MRLLLLPAAMLSIALLLAAGQQAQSDEKAKEPATVGALAPHPLDDVFKGVNRDRQAVDRLINNELFKEAVREAVKAKAEVEKERQKNPKMVGPTPEQAARKKFLEVLLHEKGEQGATEKK
jgi:hypothetical protein